MRNAQPVSGNSLPFQGKVAMITGASSGIGAAAARLFAREGAAVVVTARRGERLRALAEEINAGGGRALPVPGDVSSAEDVERVVRAAVDAFGGLDCAFNNAGFATAGTALHETDPDVYEQTVTPPPAEAGGFSLCRVGVATDQPGP